MAVAIEMWFKGATTEQYDKIVELMGLTSGRPGSRCPCSVPPPASSSALLDPHREGPALEAFAGQNALAQFGASTACQRNVQFLIVSV